MGTGTQHSHTVWGEYCKACCNRGTHAHTLHARTHHTRAHMCTHTPHTCAHTHTHTYTHTHTHTYTHTRAHTHTLIKHLLPLPQRHPLTMHPPPPRETLRHTKAKGIPSLQTAATRTQCPHHTTSTHYLLLSIHCHRVSAIRYGAK